MRHPRSDSQIPSVRTQAAGRALGKNQQIRREQGGKGDTEVVGAAAAPGRTPRLSHMLPVPPAEVPQAYAEADTTRNLNNHQKTKNPIVLFKF